MYLTANFITKNISLNAGEYIENISGIPPDILSEIKPIESGERTVIIMVIEMAPEQLSLFEKKLRR